MPETNVNDFLDELNAGVFKEKLAHTLSEAALAVVTHSQGKKVGKVNIEFSLKQIGDNHQVVVQHKISKDIPTKRGKKTEEDITDTSMHVGRGGVMSINPVQEDDHGQFALRQETDGKPIQ